MHVVATAGHVDHGKSTLVRALTGTDPDRLPEESRRGLSIELGFVWTSLRIGSEDGEVAFVDVPGHEKFLATALAGMGPVPVVLLVVAADDPWMPQAAEHLAALDALGVVRGVVAITRADLADPQPAAERARAALAPTSLAGAPVVAVSAHTGAGVPELRTALAEVLATVPEADPRAGVRLWVDRRFTMRGAGTVITGTLPEGTIRAGDALEYGTDSRVRVRSVQSLGREVEAARGVARVALNLAGETADLQRGMALRTPGAWHRTDVVDVALTPARGDIGAEGTGRSTRGRQRHPPERPLLHLGTAGVGVRYRPLDEVPTAGAETVAQEPWAMGRLVLDEALPLRIGERALLRDPGSRALWTVTVLDPAPPALGRRGAAARRAASLAPLALALAHGGAPDPGAEVQRRGLASLDLLRRIGVPIPEGVGVQAGGDVADRDRAEQAAARAIEAIREHDAAHPIDPGVPPAELADQVGLPAPLLRAVLPETVQLKQGRLHVVQAPADSPPGAGLPAPVAAPPALPAAIERALNALAADFAQRPFAAPTADRLRELGLDQRSLAAAAKAGRVLRPAPGIALPADAEARATRILADLPQPFTAAEARQAWGTSRRVALPLLEYLDARRITRRLPDDRRELR